MNEDEHLETVGRLLRLSMWAFIFVFVFGAGIIGAAWGLERVERAHQVEARI